jgi:hypothetical protein
VRLFPVTVDDGIDVHVNASYFQVQGARQLKLASKFGFHSSRPTSFRNAAVDNIAITTCVKYFFSNVGCLLEMTISGRNICKAENILLIS